METTRERALKRWSALKNERSSWDNHWRECGEHLAPWRARFVLSEKNQGKKRHEKIINNTPLRAGRILRAGMMSGLTSPARKWFRLSTPYHELNANPNVRAWLHMTTERMLEVFQRSNIYNSFAMLYGDLATFGVSPMLIDEDPEDLIRTHVFPVGLYCLATSARGEIDTLYRECRLTVAQVVERFGLYNLSINLRNRWDESRYDDFVDVLHLIEPNFEQDDAYADWRGKPYRSLWMEQSSEATWQGTKEKFLRVSGYNEFPVVCPRWDVAANDTYGYGPGMDALGDAKALIVLERMKARLIDKLADPPMVGPPDLEERGGGSILPGAMNYVARTSGSQGFEPAVKIEPRSVGEVREAIREHEKRINEAYYADLWLLIAESDRREITAEEIRAKQEEKMLQLGPTLERLDDELIDKTIDRTFAIMLRAGIVPPPPKELQGTDLRVEKMSIVAQVQKAMGLGAIERLYTFAGSVVQITQDPSVMDKLDIDRGIENYAEALGVPPDLIVEQDDVDKIRAQRAQQVAQQQAVAAAPAIADAAKTASETKVNGTTAMDELMRQMT